MEVVIDHAENKESLPGKSEASAAEPSGSQVSLPEAESGGVSSEVGTSVANVDDDKNNFTEKDEADGRTVLLKLPHRELQLLCSLLAKEGYVFMFHLHLDLTQVNLDFLIDILLLCACYLLDFHCLCSLIYSLWL